MKIEKGFKNIIFTHIVHSGYFKFLENFILNLGTIPGS